MDTHPTPSPSKEGSPQGSVLGCLLYCVTTQRLAVNLRDDDAVQPQLFPGNGLDEAAIRFWDPDEDLQDTLPVPFL